MKVRSDFVTNSSSSSYICIGVDATTEYRKKFAELIEEGADEEDEEDDGDYIEMTWGKGKGHPFNAVCTENGYVISLDNVTSLLETNSIEQIRQIFVAEAKKLGIEVDPKDVRFDYGTTYDG